jgi:ERF superfamily
VEGGVSLLLVHVLALWTWLTGRPSAACALCGHSAKAHVGGDCVGDPADVGERCRCPGHVKPDLDAESARAGAYAAERLPSLLAAMADGHDRTLLILDAAGPSWRRDLDPEWRERTDTWSGEAWKPMRPALAATGFRLVEPTPWLNFDAPEVCGVQLIGRLPSARDLIATAVRRCDELVVKYSSAVDVPRSITIASGRSSLSALVGPSVRILRDVKRGADGGWTWSIEDEAAVRARLGYDPRLVHDVAALASLDGIGEETSRALVCGGKLRRQAVPGFGSALVVVQEAAALPDGLRLPGCDFRQTAALRAAASDGGARILRTLACVGLRDDAPIDVAALVKGAGDEHGGRGEPVGGTAPSVGQGRPAHGDGGAAHEESERGGAAEHRDGREGGGRRLEGEGVAHAPQGTNAEPRGQGSGEAARERDGAGEVPQRRVGDAPAPRPPSRADAPGEAPTPRAAREPDGVQGRDVPRQAGPLGAATDVKERATMSDDDSYLNQNEPAAPMVVRAEQAPMAPRASAPSAVAVRHTPAQQPAAQRPGPRTSEDTDILFAEIAAAHAEFGELTKTRTANIESRNRGSYSYKYANLTDVMQAIGPALKRHHLVPLQIPMGDKVFVRLIHGPSGQWIEGGLPLVLPDYGADIQRLGSALTYVRRYLLTMLLGIVADDAEDDDGAAAMPQPPPRQRGAA